MRAIEFLAPMPDVNLFKAKAAYADFSRAKHLKDCSFIGADLRRANFAYADLRGAHFVTADLTEAVFQGANLRGADFVAADFGEVELYDAEYDDDTEWPDHEFVPPAHAKRV